jgi:hypothetical protein
MKNKLKNLQVSSMKSCYAKLIEKTDFETIAATIQTDNELMQKTICYRKARINDEKVNAIRPEGAEVIDTAKTIKQSMPAFVPAAIVEGARRRENVKELTGLTLCDFDHVGDRVLELRKLAAQDPHTLLVYTTVSGDGLRIIAAYERKEGETLKSGLQLYAKRFQAINEYYQALLGHPYDKQCKDVVRLSILATDDTAVYNPSATAFTLAEQRVNSRIKREAAKTLKPGRKPRRKPDVDAESVYLEMIAPKLDAEGLKFESGRHNEYVMRTGYLFNKYGVEMEDAMAVVQNLFGADYPAACSVVESCYRKTEEHGVLANMLKTSAPATGGQMPKASAAQINDFLDQRIERRRNTVKDVVEIRWIRLDDEDRSEHDEDPNVFRALTDEDLNTLSGYIEKDCALRATPEEIRQRLNSRRTPNYHPLRAYLNALPDWNPGKDPDFIAELASHIHLTDDTPENREWLVFCLKKWLVGAIMGWMKDDVVNQLMLVLIGKQGTYKTTFLSHLLPPSLREYHKLKVNSANICKDDVLAMSSYAFIQHEEMDAMGLQQNNDIKAMMTATATNERGVYERNAKRRKNIASLCGTGNQEQLLTDPTGSRRLMVFQVDDIDSPDVRPILYEGLYAQAKALAADPLFRHWMNREEQERLQEHNRQFEVVKSEEELIQRKFRVPAPYEMDKAKWLTVTEILRILIDYSHMFKLTATNIGRAMKKLGFERVRHGHAGQIGYLVILRNNDEIDRNQKQDAVDIMKEQMEKTKEEAA